MKKVLLFLLSLSAVFVIAACNGDEDPATEIDAVTVSQQEVHMINGETFDIEGAVEPDDAEQDLVWSSRNRDIAEVSQEGTIYARSPGSTTIKVVSAEDASVSNYITVTVLPKPDFVAVTEPSPSMYTGETLAIDWEVALEDADPGFTWGVSKVEFTSMNEDALTVDEYGVMEAHAPGTVLVEVRAGNQFTYVEVAITSTEATVQDGIDIPELTRESFTPARRVVVGDWTFSLNWSSDDTDYITNGGEVTRPSAEDGDQTVTMTVTTKAGPHEFEFDYEVVVEAPKLDEVWDLDLGDEVAFRGVVNGIAWNGVYIEDAYGSTFVFDFDISDDVEVGDYVLFEGEWSIFDGLYQIDLDDYDVLDSDIDLKAATDATLAELFEQDEEEEYTAYNRQGQRLNVHNLLVESTNIDNFGNFEIYLMDIHTQDIIQLRYDSRTPDFDDVEDLLLDDDDELIFEPGDTVNINAAIVGWHNGPQFHGFTGEEITHVEEEDEISLADYLEAVFVFNEGVTEIMVDELDFFDTFTLPHAIGDWPTELDVEWALGDDDDIDPEDFVDLETGEITRPHPGEDDVAITLEMTFTDDNDFEHEMSLDITIMAITYAEIVEYYVTDTRLDLDEEYDLADLPLTLPETMTIAEDYYQGYVFAEDWEFDVEWTIEAGESVQGEATVYTLHGTFTEVVDNDDEPMVFEVPLTIEVEAMFD